jgi:PAS domain S-box-containing protein
MDFKKWEELVHPDDLKESDCQLRRHFSGELPYYDFECRIKHKDGSWVWIRDRGRVITRTSDGSPLMVFGTSSDIVERKQAEEALKLRESHLTAIIENQPGLVWLKDMEGRFLVVNTAFALSRGKKSPEEVVGLTESDLCPKKLAVKYKNEDAKVIKQKKSFRVEETVFDQERIKWFETFRRPIIDRTGQVIGTTGFKYFQGDKY